MKPYHEDTSNSAQFQVRVSEFKVNMVHRTSEKHQVTDALSRLKTVRKHCTPLDDEVPVHDISLKSLVCVPSAVEQVLQITVEPKDTLFPFIAEVYTIASVKKIEKAKIPTPSKLLTVQSIDSDCRAVFASEGKPNTQFAVDSNGVLVRAFVLHDTSQGLVPASLRACYLHFCSCSLSSGHPGERCMYASMKKQLYLPHMSSEGYATVSYCHSCAQNLVHVKKQRQLKLFFPDRTLE